MTSLVPHVLIMTAQVPTSPPGYSLRLPESIPSKRLPPVSRPSRDPLGVLLLAGKGRMIMHIIRLLTTIYCNVSRHKVLEEYAETNSHARASCKLLIGVECQSHARGWIPRKSLQGIMSFRYRTHHSNVTLRLLHHPEGETELTRDGKRHPYIISPQK